MKSNVTKPPRVIYNDDSCTLRTIDPPHSVENLSNVLEYLKGTQVDYLCWLMGEVMAYSWPSKVLENFFDLQTRGEPHVWEGYIGRDAMLTLHQQGIDYLPPLIDQAHEQGLTFIGSFRLNDTHLKSYPNSVLSPHFWRNNQQYRLWEITDAKAYYNAGLDYSFPEVRNNYKAGIAEVLSTYEVDGIELDFGRNPYFFQPSEAWDKREILTEWVREIRDLVEAAGKRRGRELTLILRVPCRDSTLRTGGIDARRWIKEKLAPIFIITELVNNHNTDIEPWVSPCHEAGVLVYPSLESSQDFNRTEFYSHLMRNPWNTHHAGFVTLSDQEFIRALRAAAHNFLAQGADGIAMFNYPCILVWALMNNRTADHQQLVSLLNEIGDLNSLAWKDKYYTYYRDLPIYVEAGRPRRYHQTVPFRIHGEDVKDGAVTLRFHQIAERNPHADGAFRQSAYVKKGLISYYLNEEELTENQITRTKVGRGRIRSGFLLKAHEMIEIKLRGTEMKNGLNELAFEMAKFPHENDPYVYIYELEADVTF